MNGTDIIDTARHKLVEGLSAGAPLTAERVAELEAAVKESDNGIIAHLNGLQVVSHYLYMCRESAEECMLNEAAWIVETLARSIEEMHVLQKDCRLYLGKTAPKKASKAVRS